MLPSDVRNLFFDFEVTAGMLSCHIIAKSIQFAVNLPLIIDKNINLFLPGDTLNFSRVNYTKNRVFLPNFSCENGHTSLRSFTREIVYFHTIFLGLTIRFFK